MSGIIHPCGCIDERAPAMSISDPQDMSPKTEFLDGAEYMRHYCDEHWEERVAQTRKARAYSPKKMYEGNKSTRVTAPAHVVSTVGMLLDWLRESKFEMKLALYRDVDEELPELVKELSNVVELGKQKE